MTAKCKESDSNMQENRRKANGYYTQQQIDESIMCLVMADGEIDKLGNYSELSANALREVLAIKSHINKARILLINARNNGK